VLRGGGSAEHAAGVQWFFKEQVTSRGWYTHELRKVAVRFRRTILAEHGQEYLLQVADQLFRGDILEEKVFAVLMLQGIVGDFGKSEFKLFESWLDRVSSWADHDGLVHYLIGPMIAADDSLLSRPPRWARKKTRKPWHQRAAAVSLIHSTRQHKNFGDIQRIAEMLLTSDDDMVQKGLAWLLREAAKFSEAKITYPGRKQVFRYSAPGGEYTGDKIALEDEAAKGGKPLLAEVMRAGKRLTQSERPDVLRERGLGELARLPARYRQIARSASYPVRYSKRLEKLLEKVKRRIGRSALK
jgi:3-methyladenine DNA glycosylase AlkD